MNNSGIWDRCDMTRRCELTGKTVQYGCNVSHANNKLTKRFLPNLQSVSLFSEALKQVVRIRATPYGVRCVEANGGLDNYLLKVGNADLSRKMLAVKRQLKARQSRNPEDV
ncbi:MAG: 50S ribosomal protein L28 [Holosporales bacterium]|jgi:large subunit ribosomal protein L28|nr:50S ribosomal protein L28 [Holosporales bacterium]